MPREGPVTSKKLTVGEAAERLSVSKQVVYLLCAERKLAHFRIGAGRGTIRIPEDSLASFLSTAFVEVQGDSANSPQRRKRRVKR